MTDRGPPPLVGFNNNFRYRGLSFHIQTEDSGVERPHIITHLFVDGGRVIKTLRNDYSEHVNGPDYRAVVQRMMRDQHRAMAYDLRQGRIDPIIDGLVAETQTAQEVSLAIQEEPKPLPASDAAASASPVVDSTRPEAPSRARRSARVAAARAGAELGADFVALPPDSLDELILGYLAGTRDAGPLVRPRASSRAAPNRRPER